VTQREFSILTGVYTVHLEIKKISRVCLPLLTIMLFPLNVIVLYSQWNAPVHDFAERTGF